MLPFTWSYFSRDRKINPRMVKTCTYLNHNSTKLVPQTPIEIYTSLEDKVDMWYLDLYQPVE